MQRVEPSVPDPSSFEDEIVIEKVNRYKSPDIDQVLVEVI
jgi:hypothetical protein